MKIKCFDFTKVSRIALLQKLVHLFFFFFIIIHCWAAPLIKWTYFKHMPLSRPELCKKPKSYRFLMKFGLQTTNSFKNLSFNSLWCSMGIDHLMPSPWESLYAENKIQEHLLSKTYLKDWHHPCSSMRYLTAYQLHFPDLFFCCCCFATSYC